jgi:hypothetical protein
MDNDVKTSQTAYNHILIGKSELEADTEADMLPEALTFCWKSFCITA